MESRLLALTTLTLSCCNILQYTFTHGDSGIREMGQQFGASDSQSTGLQEGISTYPCSLTTVKIIHVNS